MGRFYKSSKGNYLDFIYKQPTNLLLKAQQAADQSLAQQEQAYGDLYGRLQMNAFGKPDTEQRDKILSGYEQRVEEKANEIRSNPLKYLNNPTELRKLSNEIYKDKTRGNWAAIESNAAARANYKKEVDALSIDQAEKNFLMRKFDNEFISKQGTLGEAGDWSGVYSGTLVSDEINTYDEVDKRMQGFNANVLAERGLESATIKGADGSQKFIITKKGTTERITEGEIKKLVDSWLKGETKIQNYFATRSIVNMPGFTEKDIEEKRKALTDYALAKYEYVKESKDISASANPYVKSAYEKQLETDDGYSTTVQHQSRMSPGSKVNDILDADGNVIKRLNGTYSGLTSYQNTINEQDKNTSALMSTNINSSTLSDDAKKQLTGIKNNAIKNGNWENYFDAAEKLGYKIPENEQKLIEKTYTPYYYTIKSNNIAKLKGISSRAIENFKTLDNLRIEVLNESEKTGITKPGFISRMKEKIGNNQELLKLFNTNQSLESYEKQIETIKENLNSIVEGDENSQSAYEYFDKNLTGVDVGYINQEDNIITFEGDKTDTPDYLIEEGDEAKFRTYLTGLIYADKKGDKISLNRVFSNLGVGQIQELPNQFEGEDRRKFQSIITDLSNLFTTQELAEGQVAVKKVTEIKEDEVFAGNDTRVVEFISDGEPVNLKITSPKVSKTYSNGEAGIHLIYDLEFTKEDGTTYTTSISKTLGPEGSGMQHQTDAINEQKYNDELSSFKSDSRFDLIDLDIRNQTKQNSNEDLVLEVPNSKIVLGEGSNKRTFKTVAKVIDDVPTYYMIPNSWDINHPNTLDNLENPPKSGTYVWGTKGTNLQAIKSLYKRNQ